MGYYQLLLGMPSVKFSNQLEVQPLKCLIVGKAQREKHSRNIRGLQSKVNFAMKNTHEGMVAVRALRERKDVMKAHTKEMVSEVFT